MRKVHFCFLTCALLACVCAGAQDTSKGTVYVAANAHLDTQWRWTVQQVIEEYLPNTLYQNFKLFEDYPDYRFSFEGAVKYAWFKEYYPEAFQTLKKYVADGHWYPAGASWDANDTNVPSPESAFRNILLAQEFYKKEFGIKSNDIMLPDCFGFSYTLPTVAAHCGVLGFHTQKLAWRETPFYADGAKWPFEFGEWAGIDGATLLASPHCNSYGWNPVEDFTSDPVIIDKLKASAIPAVMKYFGTRSSRYGGDRGGSPTPESVRFINESKGGECPNFDIRFATTQDIFQDYKSLKGSGSLPVFKGELLMDVHGTGCYSANYGVKLLNFQCEQDGFAAEAFASAADWAGAVAYPVFNINEAYKRFIWHQFHDDLTGTSLTEAYQFTWNDLQLSRNQFHSVSETSARAIAKGLDTRVKGIPVAVAYPGTVAGGGIVSQEVDFPEGCKGVKVYGPDGKEVPACVFEAGGGRATVEFLSSGAPVSVGVYDVRPTKAACRPNPSLKASGNTIENRIYKVTVNSDGDICSIIDKRCGRELVSGAQAIGLVALEGNTSDRYPAWEIFKSVIDKPEVRLTDSVSVQTEFVGSMAVSLNVDKRYRGSHIIQKIYLTSSLNEDCIHVVNNINWRTRNTLLKTVFPLAFGNPEATYDLGLGHVRRGVNTEAAYEVPAQKWADLTAADGSYGVSILPQARNGWDKPADNVLRLTMLHTPSADSKSFSNQKTLDFAHHTICYTIMGHPGALDAPAVSAKADALNASSLSFVDDKHAGALRQFSMLSSSNPAIRVECFKQAEDGDGFILRVYELSGKGASGVINFAGAIRSAERTNGIEEYESAASFCGSALNVELSPFSPATFRVRLAPPAKSAQKPGYCPVALPFNKRAISSNAFSAFGHMDGDWHSYAAEQLPGHLDVCGVPFELGEADYEDAVACEAQSIALPEGAKGVWLLVASSDGDRKAVFNAGGEVEVDVPYYSGFFASGEWAPFERFCKKGTLAYVGGHRHDSAKRDEYYVHTYMFSVYVPVKGGAGALTLPDDKEVTVFAATALLGE